MAEEKQDQEIKYDVKIEDVGPCKKKVTVTIPEEAIVKATDEQYEAFRKEAQVPGFRPGRAPRRLLEKRFGKEAETQVKLKLLAQASESAVKDNEINLLRDPDIDHEKIEIPEKGDMQFDFEVEVRPEFDLPSLEGIAVEKTVSEISDDQVEAELKQISKWSGIWAPKDKGQAVEADDQVIADAVLKIEGVDEEEKLDNIEIFVRPSGVVGPIPVEKLNELLEGAKAGDIKKTSVDVPKTYFREEYRGKKVDISVEVKDIKWLKPAELTKEFLSRLGVADEDELREKIADSLQQRQDQQVRNEMSEQIYKYLQENTKFELPVNIVAEQAGSILQRQYMNLMQQGLQKEQLSEKLEELKTSSEEQAEEQLKTFFIMDKVAEKLEIEVTDEEVNGHIAQIAIQQNQRPENMRQAMERDGSLSQFKLQVRQDKCITKMLESAKITEVEAEKGAKKAEKSAKKVAKTAKKTTKKEDKKVEKKAEKEEKPVKKAKKTTKKKTDK